MKQAGVPSTGRSLRLRRLRVRARLNRPAIPRGVAPCVPVGKTATDGG
ncbi:MAG: hypothetical protein H8F28_19580 [Fibrella sp.]|nr:hypothetical protein [Armatimonadota bacterium]